MRVTWPVPPPPGSCLSEGSQVERVRWQGLQLSYVTPTQDPVDPLPTNHAEALAGQATTGQGSTKPRAGGA